MNIQPTKGPRNHEMATATCDECGTQSSVNASHGHRKGQVRGGKPVLVLMNEGQALSKLRRVGWALVKNRLYCPECETKRKIAEEPEMSVKTEPVVMPIRQPSIEQRRQIVEMLVIAYDGKAQRYKGHDTDKTVAEALGNNVMPGWVAEIREQNFGPACGNEEIEAIRAEIVALEKQTAEKMAAIKKRIDAVCVAVGPRARA